MVPQRVNLLAGEDIVQVPAFFYLLVLFRNQHRFILGTSLALD